MFIFLLLGKLQQGHLSVIQVHQMFFVNTFSLIFSYIFKYIKIAILDFLAVLLAYLCT